MNKSATLHHLYMNTQNHITAPSSLGLSVREGKVVVSSRDVAEKFGKFHKDILKAVKNLDCSTSFTERNFAPSDYTDPTGRKLPEVLMTRDGFTFLAMGFTGAKAAQFKEAYIAEFNRMEAELNSKMNPEQLLQNPDFLIQTLTTLKEERQKRKALEVNAEKNAPYVIYGKSVEVAEGSKLVRTYAKLLTQAGMIIGERRLFALLRELGILGKTGKGNNEPNQHCIEMGYFRVSITTFTRTNGVKESSVTPYLTPKGRIWLTNKFYKLWDTTPEVFTPFVGKGSCLRPDMKDYIAHADVED